MCTDACKDVNGRDFFIHGGEIGILPEPELMRSLHNPAGWTLDLLDAPATRAYLIGEVQNKFAGIGAGNIV